MPLQQRLGFNNDKGFTFPLSSSISTPNNIALSTDTFEVVSSGYGSIILPAVNLTAGAATTFNYSFLVPTINPFTIPAGGNGVIVGTVSIQSEGANSFCSAPSMTIGYRLGTVVTAGAPTGAVLKPGSYSQVTLNGSFKVYGLATGTSGPITVSGWALVLAYA